MWQSDPECEFSFPALRRMHKNWWIITLQNSLFHINIWIEIPNSITSVCIWCGYFWSPFFPIPDSRSIWADGHRRKWKIDFGFENVERRTRNNSKKQYWLMDSYWLWATGCKYTFSLCVSHPHACVSVHWYGIIHWTVHHVCCCEAHNVSDFAWFNY